MDTNAIATTQDKNRDPLAVTLSNVQLIEAFLHVATVALEDDALGLFGVRVVQVDGALIGCLSLQWRQQNWQADDGRHRKPRKALPISKTQYRHAKHCPVLYRSGRTLTLKSKRID